MLVSWHTAESAEEEGNATHANFVIGHYIQVSNDHIIPHNMNKHYVCIKIKTKDLVYII